MTYIRWFPITFVALAILLGPSAVHGQQLTVTNKWTLDGYCLSKLPKIRLMVPVDLGISVLVRMCSDMKLYNQCLMKARAYPPLNVSVQVYERKFPSGYDVIRAGYDYCTTILPEAFELFTLSDWHILDCEKKRLSSRPCDDVPSQHEKIEIRQLLDAKSENYTKRSCLAALDHYQCMSEQYKACDPMYEALHVYHIGRLGATCLRRRNMTNPLVLTRECTQPSKSTTSDLIGVTSSFLVRYGLVLTFARFGVLSR